MKLSTTYTLMKNSKEVAVGKNQVFTSYFNEVPNSTYYVQLGSGISELPFEAVALENYEITAGDVTHATLQRSVKQADSTITYSFAATWSTVSTSFVGSICEVGFGYNNNSVVFNMLSRARFLDNDGNPVSLTIAEEDSLGVKAYMEIQKQISSSNISFEATSELTITGTLHEVNLDNWFASYIAIPLPVNLNMALLTIPDLAIDSENFNRYSGNRTVIKTDALSRTEVREADNRIDKYTGYFAPSNNYTFTHVGVYEGSANVDENYFVIIELDEPVTITEFEEFSLTLNVKLTEQEINA